MLLKKTKYVVKIRLNISKNIKIYTRKQKKNVD